MSNNNDGKMEFEIMDIKSLQTCVKDLKLYLNKAVKTGCYDLEETEKILVHLNTINRSTLLLEKYQNFVMSKVKESNEKKKLPTINENNEQ